MDGFGKQLSGIDIVTDSILCCFDLDWILDFYISLWEAGDAFDFWFSLLQSVLYLFLFIGLSLSLPGRLVER